MTDSVGMASRLPLPLETRDLRLVAAVVEAGSITAAGKRLHVSQSALSHHLAELESRLGFKLFERGSKSLRPTSKGKLLYQRGRGILDALGGLQRELATVPEPPRSLRLTTQCFTCYHWLPGVIEPLETEHPDVRVELVVDSTCHALEALEAHKVDLAVTSEETPDPRWQVEPLFTDELLVAVPPGHRLASSPFVGWADLGGEVVLTHPPSASDKEWFNREAQVVSSAIMPREVRRMPLTDAILELVFAGQGIAILSRFATDLPAAQGRLVRIPFGPRPLLRRFSGISPRKNPRALPLARLVELVRLHCAPEAPR